MENVAFRSNLEKSALHNQFSKIVNEYSLEPTKYDDGIFYAEKAEFSNPINGLDYQINYVAGKSNISGSEKLYALVRPRILGISSDSGNGFKVELFGDNPNYSMALNTTPQMKLSKVAEYLPAVGKDLLLE